MQNVLWSFVAALAACADAPVSDLEPQARILALWNPLVCGDPHRIVIELEDDDGRQVSRSAPCKGGGVTLDVPQWGVYLGRIYAWTVGPEIRSVMQVRVDVDAPVIVWTLETPR